MNIYLESTIVILILTTISVSVSLFCQEGERFSICGNNECRHTCKLPRGPKFCDPKCRPGCICLKGLVRREKDKKCVKLEKCPNSPSRRPFLLRPGSPPCKGRIFPHEEGPGRPPCKGRISPHGEGPGSPPCKSRTSPHDQGPGTPTYKGSISPHEEGPGSPPCKGRISQKGQNDVKGHLPDNSPLAAEDNKKSELEKKLQKQYDEALKKIKDVIEKGKDLKDDAVQKLREIRKKMKKHNIEINKKGKEAFEDIKKKAKDYQKKILDKIFGD